MWIGSASRFFQSHRFVEDEGNFERYSSEGECQTQTTNDIEVGEGAEGMLDFVEADDFEFEQSEVFLTG